MSARTPKRSPVTANRLSGPTSRVRFHHVAIHDKDPDAFAKKLEDAENRLVEEGWTLVGMMSRGEAVILNAQRQEAVDDLPIMASPIQSSELVSRRRREVSYHYLDDGKAETVYLHSLREAVQFVKSHLVDERYVPNEIVLADITYLEPLRDLKLLEEMSSIIIEW